MVEAFVQHGGRKTGLRGEGLNGQPPAGIGGFPPPARRFRERADDRVMGQPAHGALTLWAAGSSEQPRGSAPAARPSN